MKVNLTNLGMIAGAGALAYILYKKLKPKTGYTYVNNTQYQPVWAGDEGGKKTGGGLTWI